MSANAVPTTDAFKLYLMELKQEEVEQLKLMQEL